MLAHVLLHENEIADVWPQCELLDEKCIVDLVKSGYEGEPHVTAKQMENSIHGRTQTNITASPTAAGGVARPAGTRRSRVCEILLEYSSNSNEKPSQPF